MIKESNNSEEVKKERLLENPIPQPIVFAGLWGNPKHHRYQILSHMFSPFGVDGLVIGQGPQAQTWEAFSRPIDDAIKDTPLKDKVLIGNSIGGSFLLRSLYQNKADFSRAIFLGLDPTPAMRMSKFPERQKRIWRDLGIPASSIEQMISPGNIEKFGEEIYEAFNALKDDPRVIFIHGSKDETVPVAEVQNMSPANLIIIPGMEHNSVKELDKAIAYIMESILGLKVRRIMKPADLLELQDINWAGIIPFFSGNRIGWFVVEDGDFTLLPQRHFSEYTFIGDEKEKPPEFQVTANFRDRVFAINIPKLQQSGYKFYKPLCPMRSIYPHQAWVSISRQLNLSTQSQRVQTSKERQLEQMKKEYINRAYSYLGNHKELLDLMDDDNKLFSHLFAVYQVLLAFGFSDEEAFLLSLLHDIGKGVQILSRQLTAAKQVIKDPQAEVDLRAIGRFREFIHTSEKQTLYKAIEQEEESLKRIREKYSLSEEDLFKDRDISLKIVQELDIPPQIAEVIYPYLSGDKQSKPVKLLRLADLISPYVIEETKIDLSFIEKAVSNRLKAAGKLYGTYRNPSEYIDQDIIAYIQEKTK